MCYLGKVQLLNFAQVTHVHMYKVHNIEWCSLCYSLHWVCPLVTDEVAAVLSHLLYTLLLDVLHYIFPPIKQWQI